MFLRVWLCCALGLSLASSSEAQVDVEVSADLAEPSAVPVEADTEVAEDAVPEDAVPEDELPVIHAQPSEPVIQDAPLEEAREEVAETDAQPDLSVESEAPHNEAPQNEAPRLVLATTLGGLAGLVGGFGLSWGPSFGVAGTNESASDARVAAYMMGVTTWGTPLTTAVGIFAAGRAAGGQGHFGLTLLGTTLGSILGAGLAGVSYAADHSQALTLTGVLSIPVLQWAGGVLAYHLSHNARSQSGSRPSEPRRESLPSVSVHRGGASLGWSGSF